VNLAELALRNLARRPTRSLLLAIIVGLAVATALTLVALSRSIENGLREGVDERGADLTVTQLDAPDIMSGYVSEELEMRLAGVGGVRGVTGELAMFAPIDNARQALVAGWTAKGYFWKAMPLSEGRLPANGETRAVVIGTGIAMATKKNTGDSLDIFGEPFRIVGVSGFASAVNRGLIILPLADLQEISIRHGQVTAFHLALVPGLDALQVERIKHEIEAFGRLIVTPTDQLLRNDRNLAVLKAVSRSISIIALTMGGLSVLSALLMAVQERQREIGIMMAIGWSNTRIRASIVIEGMIVGLGGCVLGVPLAFAASLLFSSLPTIGDYLVFRPSLDMILPSLVAAVLLCALGSLYPAWQVTLLTPAQALRRA
jgi:putative ABC transport system permease protein